jgi:hypothetical protein
MAKFSKNNDEFLVVFLGRREGDNNEGAANVFFGLLGMAIVMMLFVGLINDLEKQSRMMRPTESSSYTPRNVILTR